MRKITRLSLKEACPKAPLAFASICLILLACIDMEERIQQGEAYIEQGAWDKSLQHFHRLYPKAPQNPKVLKHLGMLLSLHRFSLYTGIELLGQALAHKPDAMLREEIVLLYLAMGETANIEKELLHAEALSVEQLLSKPIMQIRSLVNCLSQKKGRSLKLHSQRLSVPLYHFLCELALRHKKQGNANLAIREAYFRLDDEDQCKALPVWIHWSKEQSAFFYKELALCQKRFPSRIALFRPIPLVPLLSHETHEYENFLFPSQIFHPLDPGAEIPFSPPAVLPIQPEKKEVEAIQTEP